MLKPNVPRQNRQTEVKNVLNGDNHNNIPVINCVYLNNIPI